MVNIEIDVLKIEFEHDSMFVTMSTIISGITYYGVVSSDEGFWDEIETYNVSLLHRTVRPISLVEQINFASGYLFKLINNCNPNENYDDLIGKYRFSKIN